MTVYTVAAMCWQRLLPMWQNRHFDAAPPSRALSCSRALGQLPSLRVVGSFAPHRPTGAILRDFPRYCRMESGMSDEAYQEQILPHVSRTFALTIPQLPAELRISVTNAYLLCRIADTIEDEPALSPPETERYMQRFVSVLAGRGDAESLAGELETRLSDRTLPSERDLVRNLRRVMNVTSAL